MLTAYYDELRRHLPSFDASIASVAPDEMVPPAGAFLIARDAGVPVACGGVRSHAPGVGEIKRMYVSPPARRHGLGRALLDALEDRARTLGMTRIVLDTAAPLDAAAGLYLSAGYAEIARYNDNPFAARWFTKVIGSND